MISLEYVSFWSSFSKHTHSWLHLIGYNAMSTTFLSLWPQTYHRPDPHWPLLRLPPAHQNVVDTPPTFPRIDKAQQEKPLSRAEPITSVNKPLSSPWASIPNSSPLFLAADAASRRFWEHEQSDLKTFMHRVYFFSIYRECCDSSHIAPSQRPRPTLHRTIIYPSLYGLIKNTHDQVQRKETK